MRVLRAWPAVTPLQVTDRCSINMLLRFVNSWEFVCNNMEPWLINLVTKQMLELKINKLDIFIYLVAMKCKLSITRRMKEHLLNGNRIN